jgi:ATP-binding cassette subfamily B protein
MGAVDPMTAILVLVGLLAGATVLSAVARGLREYLEQRSSGQLAGELERRIIDKAYRVELQYFERSESQDRIIAAQQAALVRPERVIDASVSLLQALLVSGATFALLGSLHPALAAVALLAPLPGVVAQFHAARRRHEVAQRLQPERRKAGYLVNTQTLELFAKESKLFLLGDYFGSRFSKVWGGIARAEAAVAAQGARQTTIGVALGAGLSAAVLAVIATGVVRHQYSLGDLTLYAVASAALQGSTTMLLDSIRALYESHLYLTELRQLLALPAEGDGTQRRTTAPERPGEVVFEAVTFAYPGVDVPAVRDLSFRIAPGEKVGIVGRNGAGKSTILKLVCGLYTPQAGRVLVGGVDVREWDPEALRGRLSAMFQDSVAYHGSVAENVLVGDVADPSPERIECAIRDAGIEDLVARLPRGLDTTLGTMFDEGINLSGGEWKSLALARALMRDADVLMLDEPTAWLDAEAEHELFQRIRRVGRRCTSISISHRFATVRESDRILVLHRGRLVEVGSHRDLLHRGGLYARLYGLQAEAYQPA